MRLFFALFILVLFMNLVNADIVLFKEKYSVGETFPAELNFLNLIDDIKTENIKVLDSNKQVTDIGVLIQKIDNDNYFVYFDIPQIDEGDYFLIVKDVKFLENNILIKKDFSVVKDVNDIISVKPALIIYKLDEKSFFKVDITNKGNNLIKVNISSTDNLTKIAVNNLSISKGNYDGFYFDINKENIKDTKKTNIAINYGNNVYNLPVYILKDKISHDISFFLQTEKERKYLDFYYTDIPFESYAEGSLFLENNLIKNITNLRIFLTGDLGEVLRLGYYNIDFFESKSEKELGLFFNKDRDAKKGIYSGDIVLKNQDTEVILYITINLIEPFLEKASGKNDEELFFEKESLLGKAFREKRENFGKENGKASGKNDELSLEGGIFLKNDSGKNISSLSSGIKKINKRNLSYFLIGLILLFFIAFYFAIFLKTGKNKSNK